MSNEFYNFAIITFDFYVQRISSEEWQWLLRSNSPRHVMLIWLHMILRGKVLCLYGCYFQMLKLTSVTISSYNVLANVRRLEA